jgi:hypothetical protein
MQALNIGVQQRKYFSIRLACSSYDTLHDSVASN